MAGLLVLSVSGCAKPEQAAPEQSFTIPDISIQDNGVANFVVVTYDAAAMKCVVSQKKEHMHAAPAQVVVWHVKNSCLGSDNKGRPINEFKIVFDPESPLLSGDLATDIPYRKTETFVGQVKDKGQVTDGKSYPYTFWIDGAKQADPDVIIEFETVIMMKSRSAPGKR